MSYHLWNGSDSGRQLIANYNYSRSENPYVGTNGYMLYVDPDQFGVDPMFNYVRVQGVDAIDNPKDSDVVEIFDSATNTRTGIYSFKDPEQLDINLRLPWFSSAVASALIGISEYRADSFSLIDPPMGLTVQEVVDWHNGTLMYGVKSDKTPGDYGSVYDRSLEPILWECGILGVSFMTQRILNMFGFLRQ